MTFQEVVGLDPDKFFRVCDVLTPRNVDSFAIFERDCAIRTIGLPADRTRALDLGCGIRDPEVAVRMMGVDRLANVQPDILCDFDRDPLPLADDSVDFVHSHMVLEHINNFFPLFEELHRVTTAGAILDLWMPWWASHRTWGDPTYVRSFTFQTFSFLNREAYRNGSGKTTMGQYVPNCDFQPVHSVLVIDDGLAELPVEERDRLICHGVDVVRAYWIILKTVKPVRSASGDS